MHGLIRSALQKMFPKSDVQTDQQFHLATQRKSHALYSQAEQLGKLGHWEWDHIGQKMISCSEQFAQIYEMTVDEAVAFFSNHENEVSVVHPGDQERYEQQLRESKEQQIGMDIQFRIITRSGKLRHIHQLSEKVLDDENRLITSFGTEQDITERMIAEDELRIVVEDLEQLNAQLKVANEEAEAAQAAKTAFFAQMSHEMRTPLNGVVAALALMREQGLAGKAGELLDLASKSSGNLMQVINYVLDISKLECSESQPAELEFDLPDLIGSVADIVRARALEKGLELHYRVDSRLPTTYLGDAARLRQALLNVVINAIKFTEEGSVTVDVGPASGENQTLRIEVTDTGVGIEKQDQRSIFEPFATLAPAGPAGGQQGTGLGLDIARRNIESMNGSIGVSSTTGTGTTFWIELPFPATTRSPASPSEESAIIEESTLFKGRVLLVDDNETNLMLATMILEGMGVTVTPASSGEEAVQIATASDLDLVFMDISMPGIDGFEATRQIRATLDAQSLPVVALTAYASSAERAKSEACGMNGYLTKPIERKKLITTLAAWVPRREGDETKPRGQAALEGESYQVDQAALDNLLLQIGRENLASVIAKFYDEAGRRWSALESAPNDADLAREAHTLASTCRSFGLPAVADKLNCIERHAKFGTGGQEPPCIVETGRQLIEDLMELKAVVARL